MRTEIPVKIIVACQNISSSLLAKYTNGNFILLSEVIKSPFEIGRLKTDTMYLLQREVYSGLADYVTRYKSDTDSWVNHTIVVLHQLKCSCDNQRECELDSSHSHDFRRRELLEVGLEDMARRLAINIGAVDPELIYVVE